MSNNPEFDKGFEEGKNDALDNNTSLDKLKTVSAAYGNGYCEGVTYAECVLKNVKK